MQTDEQEVPVMCSQSHCAITHHKNEQNIYYSEDKIHNEMFQLLNTSVKQDALCFRNGSQTS
jgi:hypothetical protein